VVNQIAFLGECPSGSDQATLKFFSNSDYACKGLNGANQAPVSITQKEGSCFKPTSPANSVVKSASISCLKRKGSAAYHQPSLVLVVVFAILALFLK